MPGPPAVPVPELVRSSLHCCRRRRGLLRPLPTSRVSAKAWSIARAELLSPSSPSRYLPSQAAASIVEGTVTVILLKKFVWKLLS